MTFNSLHAGMKNWDPRFSIDFELKFLIKRIYNYFIIYNNIFLIFWKTYKLKLDTNEYRCVALSGIYKVFFNFQTNLLKISWTSTSGPRVECSAKISMFFICRTFANFVRFFFSFCPFFYFRKGGHPGNICLCPSLLGVRNIYDVLEQFSLEPKKSDCYLCFLSSPSRQPVYKSTITILCQERLVSKSPNFTLFAYFLYLFS
jgi:hypothetical protein